MMGDTAPLLKPVGGLLKNCVGQPAVEAISGLVMHAGSYLC